MPTVFSSLRKHKEMSSDDLFLSFKLPKIYRYCLVFYMKSSWAHFEKLSKRFILTPAPLIGCRHVSSIFSSRIWLYLSTSKSSGS